MRITHNARPWEPACIRSHAGFVWTADRDQPSVAPQTATKGFSSLTCTVSFRQSSFPRSVPIDETFLDVTKQAHVLRSFGIFFQNHCSRIILPGLFLQNYTNERTRNYVFRDMQKNVVIPRYRRWRDSVNVFVDDPIVGKLENLLGFFLYSRNNVALLAWNNSFSRNDHRVILICSRSMARVVGSKRSIFEFFGVQPRRFVKIHLRRCSETPLIYTYHGTSRATKARKSHWTKFRLNKQRCINDVSLYMHKILLCLVRRTFFHTPAIFSSLAQILHRNPRQRF